MHLAEAYRSLARPSSALEPSHPLTGMSSLVPHTLSERLVAKPMHDFYDLALCRSIGLHPSPPSLSLGGALKLSGLAGIRTQGLRLAKAALYQLSYKPSKSYD